MKPDRITIHEKSRSSKSTLEILIINLISYLIFLAIAIFIMWDQISHHAFIAGTDSTFHMNRFYETAMQLKTGHFSYFQSLFAFHQAGRIVNAFYGPLMAYLFGGILLFCKSWINFQIITSLMALSLSGWLMYVLAVKDHIKRWASLVISIIYMTSYPVSIWPTAQKFTGVGTVFLPLAILCGVKMLRDHQIQVLSLALTMTLLVQTHVMSSLIAIMALIPMFIVGIITSKYKGIMLMNGFKAAGLTILLSGNVWGNIVEMFTTNHIVPVFPQQNLMTGTVHFYHGYITYFGVIMTIILILDLWMLIVHWQRFDYRWKTILFTGLFFLWLSSPWFPWNWVHQNWVSVTNLIQFPRRFLGIAIILILLAFGQGCSKYIKRPNKNFKLEYLKLAIALFFMACAVGSLKMTFNQEISRYKSSTVLNEPNEVIHINTQSANQLRRAFNSPDLKLAVQAIVKSTPDYLPSKDSLRTNDDYYQLHPYHLAYVQLESYRPRFRHYIVGRNQLGLRWYNHQKRAVANILPVVAYHQTQVIMNHHEIEKPKISSIGALKVNSRPGWNHVNIKFCPDLSLHLIMLITIVTWLALIGYLLICRRRIS